ncbi:hypothetical protein BS47DRAFT_1356018 [Hydnum rufescens UP504]|uniref:Uncharacterized protein n=1 Tax=Hydnum rufescens UP504 TaxID=1448309 RepID=A0A9P6AD28_9AGAM|nr:hypothetical protein BS47DRAFT_1356018 [Hydnum rufescens UP504]
MVHVHTCYTSHADNRNQLQVHLSLDPPKSRRAHHVDLDLLRQDLIDHYPKVKAMLPLFMSEKARPRMREAKRISR